MDKLDRDRLLELARNRNTLAIPSMDDVERWPEPSAAAVAPGGLGEQLAAYWQGRIDEYVAQNAIEDDELAGVLLMARAG